MKHFVPSRAGQLGLALAALLSPACVRNQESSTVANNASSGTATSTATGTSGSAATTSSSTATPPTIGEGDGASPPGTGGSSASKTPPKPRGGTGVAPLPGPSSPTPLVLDWNRDGVITTATSLGLDPVAFDIMASGHRTRLEWIAPGDRFLALDLNQNGRIDSGRELFGDATLMPDADGSLVTATHGFLALGQYDRNADGVIDRRDPVFGRLMLWNDANHNGESESHELTLLKETDVLSLSLHHRSLSPEVGALASSRSFVGQRATYKTVTGREYQLADVYFHIVTQLSMTSPR